MQFTDLKKPVDFTKFQIENLEKIKGGDGDEGDNGDVGPDDIADI